MIVWAKQATEGLTKAKSAKQWAQDESYIGFLDRVEAVTTDNGPGTIYHFTDSNDSGKKLTTTSSFWKSVNLGFGMANVQVGNLVMITCTDTTYKQGKSGVKFEVRIGTVK